MSPLMLADELDDWAFVSGKSWSYGNCWQKIQTESERAWVAGDDVVVYGHPAHLNEAPATMAIGTKEQQ
jgi:hypothetical protein